MEDEEDEEAEVEAEAEAEPPKDLPPELQVRACSGWSRCDTLGRQLFAGAAPPTVETRSSRWCCCEWE